MLGGIKDLMKMRSEAMKLQDQMKKITIIGKSKEEQVEVTIDGTQEILDMIISDEVLNPLLKDSLIKQMKEAFKDAQKKLQKEMAKDMDMDKLKGMLGGN